jgi:carbamoylphosphate synthase large subunit
MSTKVLLLGPQAVRLGDSDADTLAIDEAARALRDDGHEVIVVTPRLGAPVCTLEGIALWVEPLTAASVAAIALREKPDHVLALLGGEDARRAIEPSAAEPVDARHEGEGPELEVVVARDASGAVVVVGTCELVGARGIAACDAVAVFPARITDAERTLAEDAARTAFAGEGGAVGSVRVGLGAGGAVVLAVRPWFTRGVAFVGRARGLALGAVAARLAVGGAIEGSLPPPALHDRIVVRVPRFSFEPFGARALDGVPKSTGEAHGFGATFHEAWLHAVAALDRALPAGAVDAPCDGRLEHALAAVIHGADPAVIARAAGVPAWVAAELATAAAAARAYVASPHDRSALLAAKRAGYSDRALAALAARSESDVRTSRITSDVLPKLALVNQGVWSFTYDGGTDVTIEVAVAGTGPTRIGRGPDAATPIVEVLARLGALGKRALLVDTAPRSAASSVAAATCVAAPDAETFAELARLTGALSIAPLAPPDEGGAIAPTDARKVDVDLLVDDERAVVCGVVEYVERAGVSAADSAAFVPPQLLAPELQRVAEERARSEALALAKPGAAHVRLAIVGTDVRVMRATAGASGTFTLHARVAGTSFGAEAANLLLGGRLALEDAPVPSVVVARESVMPFRLLDAEDPRLGASTRSTGEGCGFADTMPRAYAKALAAVGVSVTRPTTARPVALLVVAEEEKSAAVDLARRLRALGFVLRVSGPLREMLDAIRIPYQNGTSDPLAEGDVGLAIVTTPPEGALRRRAMREAIPYVTTLDLAKAVCAVLEEPAAPPPRRFR